MNTDFIQLFVQRFFASLFMSLADFNWNKQMTEAVKDCNNPTFKRYYQNYYVQKIDMMWRFK